MRLFVALELPAPVRERIGVRVERQRGSFPAAGWVPARNLHLTLVFLGDAEPAGLPALVAELRGALSTLPVFTAGVEGVGGFPERGPVRVVWLGLGPAAELAALAATARGAVTRAGFVSDDRPFRPHLTLARCRAPWPSALRERLFRLAPEVRLAFPVERAALIESELSPGGSRYHTLEELALAVAA